MHRAEWIRMPGSKEATFFRRYVVDWCIRSVSSTTTRLGQRLALLAFACVNYNETNPTIIAWLSVPTTTRYRSMPFRSKYFGLPYASTGDHMSIEKTHNSPQKCSFYPFQPSMKANITAGKGMRESSSWKSSWFLSDRFYLPFHIKYGPRAGTYDL